MAEWQGNEDATNGVEVRLFWVGRRLLTECREVFSLAVNVGRERVANDGECTGHIGHCC